MIAWVGAALLGFLTFLEPSQAYADDLVTVMLTISNNIPAGQTGAISSSATKTFSTQNEAESYFETNGLSLIFPNYNASFSVTAVIGVGGASAIVTYPGTSATASNGSSGSTGTGTTGTGGTTTGSGATGTGGTTTGSGTTATGGTTTGSGTGTTGSGGTTTGATAPASGTTVSISVPGTKQTFVLTATSSTNAVSQVQAVANGTGTIMTTTGQVVTSAQFVQIFQKAVVQSSPINITAGSPVSLQSQLVANSFSQTAFSPQSDTSMANGPFAVGIEGGKFIAGGFGGEYISVPLSYSYNFDDSGYAVGIRVPLTYTQIQNHQIGSGEASVALRIPVGDRNWFISPSIGYGFSGSQDLLQAAQFLGGALTSRYSFELFGGEITFGNMVGFYYTEPVVFNHVKFDADLNNIITKNGIQAEIPIIFWLIDTPLSLRGSYAWTYFFGNGLYTTDEQEFGISIGAPSATGILLNSLRFGVTGTVAKKYRAITGRFSFNF